MEYDLAARQRLGREIRAARAAAGYTREAFAAEIGRSGRQVQALENGESGVGPDTRTAAARALGWPVELVYELLEGKSPDLRSPSPLTVVSDEELAAEVLRRMKAGGEGDGRDAAPIASSDDPDPDAALGLRVLPRAARRGTPNLRRGNDAPPPDPEGPEGGA